MILIKCSNWWTDSFLSMWMCPSYNVVLMALSILYPCKPMVVNLNSQPIRLELNMEQGIAMLNVLMILNLFTERPILRTGMMIRDIMDLVVLNLMFGRQTKQPMLIRLILAKCQVIIDVRVVNVEMEHRDRMEYVIKMDVIWILSEMEIKTFMGLDPTIRLIQLVLSRLSLNLLQLMALIMEIFLKLEDSMSRTAKKYHSQKLISQVLEITIPLLIWTVEIKREYLVNLQLFRMLGVWSKWGQLWKTVWCWCWVFGMIMMPICYGLIAIILWIRILMLLELSEDLVLEIQVNLGRLKSCIRMLLFSLWISSLEWLIALCNLKKMVLLWKLKVLWKYKLNDPLYLIFKIVNANRLRIHFLFLYFLLLIYIFCLICKKKKLLNSEWLLDL